MKKNSTYIVLFLMMFLMLTTLTIGKTHAFSTTAVDIIIHEDGTYSQDDSTDELHFHTVSSYESYNTYLMFEDGTKLTYRYLLDNPDFSLTFKNTSEAGGSLTFKSSDINCLGFKSGTLTTGQSITLSSESKIKYHNYAISQTLSEWFTERSSELEPYLDLPVVVFSNNVNNTWSMDVTGSFIKNDNTENEGSGGVVDGTEDDNSGLLSGIKDFFTGLFDGFKTFILELVVDPILMSVGAWFDNIKETITNFTQPITNMLEEMERMQESSEAFAGGFTVSIETLVDQFKGSSLSTVIEYFQNISYESIGVLHVIYQYPIIADFIKISVAIAVFSGIFMFFVTF